MREIKRNYLKILRIEIEDLKQDIEALIEGCRREHESELLTHYVFMENLIVFRNELLGVDYFFKVLDSVDPDRYETLDNMTADLMATFRRMVEERGLPRDISYYVERKLMKVKQYVLRQVEPPDRS